MVDGQHLTDFLYTDAMAVAAVEAEDPLNLAGDIAGAKAGGITITGGTGSGNDLTLQSTSHATKGQVISNDQLLINGVAHPQIILKSSDVAVQGSGIQFYDKVSALSDFIYYAPFADIIYLGDALITLQLRGINVECGGIPFKGFKLSTTLGAAGAGSLWFNDIVDMFEARFNAGSRGWYIGSSWKMRLPLSAHANPSTGEAYFDATTKTLNVWNGVDYTSFKGS